MPKILKIKTNPDPSLRQRSVEITPDKISSKHFTALGADMALTMLKKDGVGLAAPQIGKNIRLICVNTKEGPVLMINPKITKRSFLKEWGEEGCLSVPDIFGLVKRSKKIRCQFINTDGKKCTIDAGGLMARVVQHEVDHLDGILFIDKAKDLKQFEAKN